MRAKNRENRDRTRKTKFRCEKFPKCNFDFKFVIYGQITPDPVEKAKLLRLLTLAESPATKHYVEKKVGGEFLLFATVCMCSCVCVCVWCGGGGVCGGGVWCW